MFCQVAIILLGAAILSQAVSLAGFPKELVLLVANGGFALVIMIEIGLLTPPVGVNLFVLTAVSKGRASLGFAARASTPYWLIQLVVLTLITAFPKIALFLPNLVMP